MMNLLRFHFHFSKKDVDFLCYYRCGIFHPTYRIDTAYSHNASNTHASFVHPFNEQFLYTE